MLFYYWFGAQFENQNFFCGKIKFVRYRSDKFKFIVFLLVLHLNTRSALGCPPIHSQRGAAKCLRRQEASRFASMKTNYITINHWAILTKNRLNMPMPPTNLNCVMWENLSHARTHDVHFRNAQHQRPMQHQTANRRKKSSNIQWMKWIAADIHTLKSSSIPLNWIVSKCVWFTFECVRFPSVCVCVYHFVHSSRIIYVAKVGKTNRLGEKWKYSVRFVRTLVNWHSLVITSRNYAFSMHYTYTEWPELSYESRMI